MAHSMSALGDLLEFVVTQVIKGHAGRFSRLLLERHGLCRLLDIQPAHVDTSNHSILELYHRLSPSVGWSPNLDTLPNSDKNGYITNVSMVNNGIQTNITHKPGP